MRLTALLAACLLLTAGCMPRPIMNFEYDPSGEPQELRYIFQDPEGVYLTTLREDYGLLSRTAAAGSDLERSAILCEWVHGLWEHHPENVPSKGDPLTILWEAEEAEGFRTIEYAVVLSGALQSVAIPARFITMHSHDIEQTMDAHVVVEAYLRDEQRWIMLDPRRNRIPMHDGTALSVLQLQEQMSESPREITYYRTGSDRSYTRWIREYLYYFHTNQDSRLHTEMYAYKNLMLVPQNLPTPRYYSPYHREQGFTLSDSASVTHDPDYFYGRPNILFDDDVEAGAY